MSYVIDVYRGDVPAQRNFVDLRRLRRHVPAAHRRPHRALLGHCRASCSTAAQSPRGRRRRRAALRTVGLGKKVLLANVCGELVSRPSGEAADRSVLVCVARRRWPIVLQIYFDFSGYSDMAIGLGRMFGFRFLENFDYPYHLRVHHGVLAALAHDALASGSATMSISRWAATA